MALRKATAPIGQRADELLSADNFIPERHVVIDTLRRAAPRLGLGATVITTLDAMLSCLAPRRTHHTVFASNATLTFRRNSISDRTLRRHAAILQEAGLISRNDSPNGKRYTRHNRREGKTLRFGFDLSPLFLRLQEIGAMAVEEQRDREEIAYLRSKIRAAAFESLEADETDPVALDVGRLLRRKLTIADCTAILDALTVSEIPSEADDCGQLSATVSMSASDGQNVRHHHKSSKEQIDKETGHAKSEHNVGNNDTSITVPKLISSCPEATQFALEKIDTPQSVIKHARTLAPMVGITANSYEAATKRLGAFRAAATVWAIIQCKEKIGSVGAYFHAITVGQKSENFSPERFINQLSRT